MSARIIISIIMAIILMGWVIGVAIAFLRKETQKLKQGDFIFQLVCEKCNTSYQATCAQVVGLGMSKTSSRTRTKRNGAVLENNPVYSSYSKRVMCPHCQKKCYAKVLNINEYNMENRGQVLADGIKALLLMAVGGMIILMLTKIPISIVDYMTQNRVEQMQQERYDEMKQQVKP